MLHKRSVGDSLSHSIPGKTYLLVACLCWIAASILFAGCSYTRMISKDGDAGGQKCLSIEKFNREIESRPITIRLQNGSEYAAADVKVTRDSTSFQFGANRMVVSNDSIEHYLWVDHLGGAGDGFLLTILPAVLLTSKYEINDAEGRFMPVPLGAMMVGCATIGSGVAGKSYYYEFSSDTTTPR